MERVNDSEVPLLPVAPQEPAQNSSSNLSVVPVFFMSQLACVFYCSMQVLIKDVQVNNGVSVCEISFLRTLSTLVSALIVLAITKQNIIKSVQKDYMLPLLTRCLSGSLAFICVTKTVELIPISMFQVMSNLTPFASGLLAYLWLGDRLSPFMVVAMIIAFGGIALVTLAKPKSEVDVGEEKVFDDYTLGIVLAFFIIFVFAIGAVTTRRIRDLHYSVIQFYLALVGFIVSSIWLLFNRRTNEVFQFGGDATIWLKIFGASFCHFFAQMLTTCANQSMNPATVGMFMYSQLVIAYLADVFFFDTQLTALQFLGAAVIVSCSVAAAVYKRLVTDKADKVETEEAAKVSNSTEDEGDYKRV